MNAVDLASLIAQRDATRALYHELMRVPSLSVGLYTIPAGAPDPQQPHSEDEVYHVVGGRGMIRVGEEERAVAAGTVVFVAAGVAHRFHSITEDMTILVFFAPAEYSRANAG